MGESKNPFVATMLRVHSTATAMSLFLNDHAAKPQKSNVSTSAMPTKASFKDMPALGFHAANSFSSTATGNIGTAIVMSVSGSATHGCANVE